MSCFGINFCVKLVNCQLWDLIFLFGRLWGSVLYKSEASHLMALRDVEATVLVVGHEGEGPVGVRVLGLLSLDGFRVNQRGRHGSNLQPRS